jgi:hypothetical protein
MFKMRNLLFSGLLLAALLYGLIPDATAQTTCTDQFNACQNDGHRSYDYCDGLFCGCLYATYGVSCATVTSDDKAATEKSLAHKHYSHAGENRRQQ